ncbi:hypothetical protein P8C59_004872 [Phyllachora maydis]|uniref:Exoribonuclease phosphorolytic domain-containing protein n=1 Tax=Phyllachora maydis TaxID=1825666 RepID=A0AAD9I4D9_9PEZI|nr:hypothetical protein P8C59_004872 [Phyllachora maydis]
MPRDAEASLNEKQFILKALGENLRLDGRGFEDYRPLDLIFGEEYGVANVFLGKTRVLAKASAEVTVPYSDRPLDGIFTIATELSPMTAPSFEELWIPSPCAWLPGKNAGPFESMFTYFPTMAISSTLPASPS